MWVRPVSTPISRPAWRISAAASGRWVAPASCTTPGLAAAMRSAASRSAGPPRITGVRPSSACTRGASACQASSSQCFCGRVVKGAKTANRPASRWCRPISARVLISVSSATCRVGRNSPVSSPSCSARYRYSELIRRGMPPLGMTSVMSHWLPSREPRPMRRFAPDSQASAPLLSRLCMSIAVSNCLARSIVRNWRMRPNSSP